MLANPIAIAVAVAVVARIAHMTGFARSPLAAALILDAEFYDAWARRIAAGDWIGQGAFFANPLYAYFLGVLYRLFGPSAELARLVQHALGVGTVALIAMTGRRAFGAGPALAAGLLAALYRPFLLYEDLLLTETLIVFLGALALYLALAADQARSGAGPPGRVDARHLAAGLVLGLGLLARPTLLPLAVILWLVVASRRGATIAALGLVLAVAPVTIRNWAVAGSPILITAHGGETFYVGNRPGADGSNLQPDFVRSGPLTEHEDYRREAARRLGREVGLVESSRYWRNEALKWIGENPGDWLRLTGKKASLLFHAYEKGDNEDPETAAEMIAIERLPLPAYPIVLALGILGMASALAFRGRVPGLLPAAVVSAEPPGRAAALLALGALAYALGILLYFVTARYRLPLAVPLLPLAGYGVVALVALAGTRALKPLVPAALLVAGIVLVLHRPLAAIDRNNPAIAAVNLGYLREQAGDVEGAIASYREAIGLAPRFALAHFNLGVAERRRGNLEAAGAAFRQALAIDPEYADALDQLAMTLEQGGERDSSLVLYHRAIAIDSTRARYWKDLGRLHVLRGEPELALASWIKAFRLDPTDSTTARRAITLQYEMAAAAQAADSARAGGGMSPGQPGGMSP